MYYRRALRLQAFLDMASEDGKTNSNNSHAENFKSMDREYAFDTCKL